MEHWNGGTEPGARASLKITKNTKKYQKNYNKQLEISKLERKWNRFPVFGTENGTLERS